MQREVVELAARVASTTASSQRRASETAYALSSNGADGLRRTRQSPWGVPMGIEGLSPPSLPPSPTGVGGVEAPHFLPRGGVFASTALVNIFADTPGSQIYYSTNGSAPTTTHYEGCGVQPLSVYLSKSCTVKAVAALLSKPGGTSRAVSEMREVTFRIERHGDRPSERTPSPSGGVGVQQQQHQQHGTHIAGVGLLLEKSQGTGHVRVRQIMPGGAADMDGSVSEGDRLVSIDDVYVDQLPFQTVLESMKVRTR